MIFTLSDSSERERARAEEEGGDTPPRLPPPSSPPPASSPSPSSPPPSGSLIYMIFSGLISRCPIPSACKCASPDATCSNTTRASSSGSGRSAMSSNSSPPRINSVTISIVPFVSKKKSTSFGIDGCGSFAAICSIRSSLCIASVDSLVVLSRLLSANVAPLNTL